MSELTKSQKVFCQEYIYDWNATRAYKVAYPSVKTDSVARSCASQHLTKLNIQAYIELIQKDLEKLAGISRMQVLDEHRKLAFSSIAHLHNTWITLREFEDLTDEQKASIQEISTKVMKVKIGEGEIAEVEFVKIKLYDKQKSLDSLSKMLGYNEPEKRDVTVTTAEIPKISITFRDAD